MSDKLLSDLDYKKADGMHYMRQPRGPGTAWVFKMPTPRALIGLPNPWDGKPFRKEISRGLGTRHPVEARKRRDIALGDVRKLQYELSDAETFSLSSAIDWSDQIKAVESAHGDPRAAEGIALILADKLEQAEARGVPLTRIQRFSHIATGKGYSLNLAHSQYVLARSSGNPFGYVPLKRTTVMGLETAVKHLSAFLSDEAKTACLEDVTPELARRFRDNYLPSARSHRAPNGLSAKTTQKNITLLQQMWVWAIENGHTSKRYKNPWEFPKGIRRRLSGSSETRQEYQPAEMSKLLQATFQGTREGDLIRLAIATGCRADEIATITADQVRPDGKGFSLIHGKGKNALRYIPVVGEARALLQARMAAHGSSGRVFPDWPIRPASGKAAAVSQWFTRFRRTVLGNETDDRLALHSPRHTWRTVARRARVNEADINDLGGWAGPRSSNSTYDHGLLEEQLEEAQLQVWAELKRTGYLEGF